MTRFFVVALVAVIAFSAFAICPAGRAAQSDSCNFEENKHLLEHDLTKLEKNEITIFGLSAEGAVAKIYRRRGQLIAIQSIFYGEGGKCEYNYNFELINRKRYVVEIVCYDYTDMIYHDPVKIASITTRKFFVCEGRDPNYPNGTALWDSYKNAIATLADILKAEKTQK